MREIKFKLLFKNKEDDIISKIYSLDDLISMDLESIYDNLEGELHECESCSCNNESQNFCDCGCMYEDYELFKKLEYTGLKDKNGKECYDGDIYKNGENGLIGVMEYHDSLGGYLLYANEKKNGSQYTFIPFHEMDNTDIEIIGNIHQNKELLK